MNKFIFISLFLFCIPVLVFPQTHNRELDSLERMISTSTDKSAVLNAKAALMLEYFRNGKGDKAEKFYTGSLAEAIKLKLDGPLALIYHTRGTIYYYASLLDSALFYYEKALSIRKRLGDDVGILKSTSNIGGIYFMMGDHKKALEYYENALKKESELHYAEGEHVPITNIGTIYSSMKINAKALEYFRKAQRIYKDNQPQLIYVLDGLSGVYRDLKQHDSAIHYAVKAKNIAESLQDRRSLAYELNTLGLLYNAKKKYEPAKRSFREALPIALDNKDKRLELTLYANLASSELFMGRTDSAFPYIGKIIALQKELNLKNNRAELAELFAKYYFDKKDYELACYYMSRQGIYKDSLYSVETTNQIADMQTRYETEKKEKENQLLISENKVHKTTRNYLLAILAVAFIAIVGAVYAYRKISGANRLLNTQKAAIEQKNAQLEIQKNEISHQKDLVDEKQKEILDSINYARRIQFALLASDNLLKNHLGDHFVLFRPKDVVSGDFYWAVPTPEGFVYITADCTGHGVPGAFMSLLNISKLSQVIHEKNITRPDLVLNHVRKEIIAALNPEGGEVSKDGMDAIVCKLNMKERKLEFSAANNSFYILRNKQIMTCRADKMPVGMGHDDSIPFTYNEIALEKGDIIYTFTDGFADQFGGDKGKKFKYKQLEDLLITIGGDPMPVQKQKLDHAFGSWKGALEQVDDVCIIGVKIT